MKANLENSIEIITGKEDNLSSIDRRKYGKTKRETNKQAKIRTICSIILIMMGILLMLYPKFKDLYEDNQQRMLIKKWRESFSIIDNNEQVNITENSTLLDGLKDKGIDIETEDLEEIDTFDNGEITEEINLNQVINDEYVKINMLGMLIIDSIELNLPILNKTTKENLSIALTTIEPDREPGQIGNLAIAGHRSHDYGRNFNRLNEITEGDLILVDVGKTTYTYTVTEILIVNPEDVWVLDGDGISKEITLVTCHPLKNPTHRMIIKGKIIE
jgi:sortase A